MILPRTIAGFLILTCKHFLMKLNGSNIFEHLSQGLHVYYATQTGIMVGEPALSVNLNDEFENNLWLIIGSMAMIASAKPERNSVFNQPGYFSTFDEAVGHHRLLLVDLVKRSNESTLKDIPIPMDDLDDFAKWVDDEDYFDNGNTVVGALRNYRERK